MNLVYQQGPQAVYTVRHTKCVFVRCLYALSAVSAAQL